MTAVSHSIQTKPSDRPSRVKAIGQIFAQSPFHLHAIGILCFALILIGGLWITIEAILDQDRDEAMEDIRRQNTNLTRVFEEHTARTLDGIDEILLRLVRRYEANGPAINLPDLWARIEINSDLIHSAAITDSSGHVIFASKQEVLQSIAGREHINVHFSRDSGEVFIGKPVQSRLDGTWSFHVTRRANRPDGSLLGVVTMAVNPFYFSDIYKEVDIGRNGHLAMVGLDGVVRTILAEGPVDLTLNVSRGQLLKQQAIAPNGHYIAQTVADGVTRLFSYRTVKGYPLIVAVGVAQDEGLAAFMYESRRFSTFAVLGSLAILAFATILIAFGDRARRHQLASEQTALVMAAARDQAETAGKLLRDIADHLPVLIAYLDTERRYRFVNKTGALWLARPASDILGKKSIEINQNRHAVDNDQFFEQLSKGPILRDATINYPDGKRRSVESTIVPSHDSNGRLSGYYRLTTDVTDRKRLDEKLRETQKLEAIGQLTGGIAHDFNNLLMVIIGNLDILIDSSDLPPKFRAYASTAFRASQRGADLTKQLLSFARQQALTPALTDLNDQVREIGMMLRRTIPQSIAIEAMPHPEPVTTMVDPSQLNNALLNLAINARDAMKSGGLLLFATAIMEIPVEDSSASEIVPAGRYAAITVRDSGHGMSADVMAQAFEPFFTTKPMGQGTGLGLSMVYGFVKQSGGYIRLSSNPGQGATVQLLFPLCASTAMPQLVSDGQPSSRSSDSRRRILVVEDMEDVLAAVTAMLSTLGFDTVAAVDGSSALQTLAEQGPFDGMLTDIGLPGNLSGLDLADLAAQRLATLKVVTMSGYNEQQVIGRDSSSRERPHLRKPFQRADLAKAMAALFPSDDSARA